MQISLTIFLMYMTESVWMVNINQIAYTINIYPGVFSDIQFQATNVFLKKIEDLLLKITEKLLWDKTTAETSI